MPSNGRMTFSLYFAPIIASELPRRHVPRYLSRVSKKTRQMHLGMFLQGAGHHLAGWRYPGANSGSETLPHLIQQAVTAERAKFDMVFLADGLTSNEDGHPSQIARFDPMLVLATFATATNRIGL